MKRIVSITALALVVLMMLACLAACSEENGISTAATEKPSLAGSYKLIETGGISTDAFKEVMDSITLDIDANNKGVMKYDENEMELTFDEAAGTVTGNGSSIPYTFDGKKLTMEDETGKLVFEKK